jgi:peroxiredoxin
MRILKHGSRVLTTLLILIGLSSFLGGCLLVTAPPIASFTRTPYSGTSPLSVFFDAAASYDPDGVITSYTWQFGDESTGEGVSVNHTYEAPGSYDARLTITDEHGATASTTRSVTVSTPEESDEGIPEGTQIGETAPSFTLEDVDGQNVSLLDLRGHVIILDFWKASCPVCLASMPHLERLRQQYQADGLILLSVILDPSPGEAEAFLQDMGYEEHITLWESQDAAVAVRDLYGVTLVPYTFVIDRQGIIQYADHPMRLKDRHIEPWL